MNFQDIPLIDHHAHNILKAGVADTISFAAAFTLADNSEIIENHSRNTLFYRRSLRDISKLLKCQPTEESIIQCRQKLELESLIKKCFKSANIEAIYLDDGFLPDEVIPYKWYEEFVIVKHILRLEYLAERLILAESKFDAFIDSFRQAIDPPPPEVIAFKSICSHLTGLNIQSHDKDEVKSSFYAIQQEIKENPPRLEDKPLIDYLLIQALEIAAKHKFPIQFSTGFGTRTINSKQANPLDLRYILETRKFSKAPIVLLHGAYPYTREAGYLASVYPQVYLDFGMTIPFLSVSGMESSLTQLLELAPTSKIMYSSSASKIPELYFLAAKWSREILHRVLYNAVKNQDLISQEIDGIALAILRNNAQKLYN
ncbi:MAG: amidohydrolase family protein [Xenococcaceae cyanobacterium MO_207.B15]|nr:amidohydrolase family protein [Xenococcaceae cyanobacterium MO_207.B15]